MSQENVLGDTDFSQDATTTTNLQSTIWSGESVTGMASSAQVISTTTKTSAASTGSATYSECQNGGSMTDIPGSQSCQCPLQYAGEWCERYRRDCQDATMNTDGVYYIQPVSAPQAFQVYCYWYWQKTHFLSRTTQQLFNMTWETAKKGFGNTTSPDFFIGLENLHHLTSQATYHMEIKMREAFLPYIQYMAIYNQFHVQDETSSFALSYSEFWAAANIIGSVEEDAFGYSPLDFCTWDRDCYDGCAATRGMPGWYDSDCDGYSPFGEILEWPLSGGSKEMDDVQFALYRPGEFYS
ncbi:hypothetical protein BaRGS_00007709 [Batillaria attramentaria]|uniref:Uncharacterized protein n=1 Tax=Batillaria attramentaria TaxID=370345 RepID=A0ABD0LP27_9CAEN